MPTTARSKVSYREFGALLEEKLAVDKAFRNALDAECGIRRRYPSYRPFPEFRKRNSYRLGKAELLSSKALGFTVALR